jgi:hypothetical protein
MEEGRGEESFTFLLDAGNRMCRINRVDFSKGDASGLVTEGCQMEARSAKLLKATAPESQPRSSSRAITMARSTISARISASNFRLSLPAFGDLLFRISKGSRIRVSLWKTGQPE